MTSSATVTAAPPAGPGAKSSRLPGWVVAVPDRVLLAALCAILATTIPVQLNIFHPYTVFPLFLVLIAVTWPLAPDRYLPDGSTAATTFPTTTVPPRPSRLGPPPTSPVSGYPATSRASWLGTALALVFVLGWLLVQRHYFSELLSIRRDPAIYTLRGIWLMNHSSPDVTLGQQLLDIKKAVPKIGLDFGAETGKATRYLQSTTIVPGLIAVAGWVGGIPLLLQADVVIGAVALICVYAVARRMAGPIFGLVPTVALGLSLPMAAFSRVAYTEPLSLIAVMACLLGLWQAARTHRRAMWLLAGIGAGCVPICRIDGWVVVIGAFVGIGIWGAFAASRAVRRKILAGLGWFAIAVFPIGALGATDLILHSPDYLRVLRAQWKPMALAVPAVALLAVLATLAPGLDKLAGWFGRHSKVVSRVVVAVIGLAMLLVIARPLFFSAHFIIDAPGQAENMRRQTGEGLPIDPSRSYDDRSLVWISWYLGWPAVIAGCLAGLWAVRVAIRRRAASLVVVTAVIAVNAAAYLNIASITPDQIWAMRRFLPVILPGGLLLAGWGLREVWQRRDRIAARVMPGLEPGSRHPLIPGLVAVGAAVIALFPVLTWGSIFGVREGAGQYDLVQKACAHIANQKVLLVGNIPQMGFYQPTFRNICNSAVITVPASTLVAQEQQIAKVVSLWGPGPVKVVSFYKVNVPWSRDPGDPWFTDTYQMWESVLSHRPVAATTETTQIWLGTARADGQVVPE